VEGESEKRKQKDEVFSKKTRALKKIGVVLVEVYAESSALASFLPSTPDPACKSYSALLQRIEFILAFYRCPGTAAAVKQITY